MNPDTPSSSRPPILAPTPIPAFAPVLRPPYPGAGAEDGKVEAGDVGTDEGVELPLAVFEGVPVAYVGVPDLGRY
jgi:hypothetical protein